MDAAGRGEAKAEADVGRPNGSAFEKVLSVLAEAPTCTTGHPALSSTPALSCPDFPLHDFAKRQATHFRRLRIRFRQVAVRPFCRVWTRFRQVAGHLSAGVLTRAATRLPRSVLLAA